VTNSLLGSCGLEEWFDRMEKVLCYLIRPMKVEVVKLLPPFRGEGMFSFAPLTTGCGFPETDTADYSLVRGDVLAIDEF